MGSTVEIEDAMSLNKLIGPSTTSAQLYQREGETQEDDQPLIEENDDLAMITETLL